MIDYTLAEKLCDADFPKKKFWTNPHTESIWFPPTLSELIEACGDHLIDIVKTKPGHWRVHGQGIVNWEWTYGTKRDWGYSISGKTPEEAVAKLWLALNKPVDNR